MLGLLDVFNRYRTAKTESEAEASGKAMFEMLQPRVSWIIRAGTREEVAKDVTQDFWASLIAGLPQFRGDSDAQAWGLCRAIAIRRCIDWIRKNSKLKTDSLDYSEEIRDAIEASAQVAPFAPGERLDAEGVMKLIAACNPEDARLVDLRYFGGFSHREIGQFVGLSEGAVHMRIHRALEAASAAITKGERYV